MPSYTKNTKIIFLDLPLQTQKEIDKLRSKYNPASVKRGVAHITFKQDEDYLIDNSTLIKIVEEAAYKMSPFELIIENIRINVSENKYTIFISFKKNLRLNQEISKLSKKLEIHVDKESPDALSSTYWEQSENFFPHITICTGKGKKEGRKILDKIQKENIQMDESIKCNSLSVCEWNKDHWDRKKRIRL